MKGENDMGSQGENLQDKKTEYEIEKLKHEIRNSQNPLLSLWIESSIKATPGLLAVIVTVGATLWSGILDVKREHLAIDTQLLELKKSKLETEAEAIQEENAKMKSSLEEAQSSLRETQTSLKEAQVLADSLEKQNNATKILGKINGTIGFLEKENGYSVVMDAYPCNCDVATSRAPVYSLEFIQALSAITDVPHITELIIDSFKMKEDEVRLISTMSSLKSLRLVNNALDDDLFNKMVSTLPGLSDIHIGEQNIESPRGLELLCNLEIVNFGGCPFTDEGMKFLEGSRSKLKAVFLENTQVSDKSIPFLLNCNVLKEVSLLGAKVSVDGLNKLAKNTSIELIVVRNDVFGSPVFADEPNDSPLPIIPHEGTIPTSGTFLKRVEPKPK